MRVLARQVRLSGVVLRLRDVAESHRVVDFLSLEEGRVALLARGARRSRKRFQGLLDLFQSLTVSATVAPGLWSLDGAELVSGRFGIRRDLDGVRRASLLVEITSALTGPQQVVPEIYQALSAGLDAVDHGELSRAALALPALLRAAGLVSAASHCGGCGRARPERVALGTSGRLLCGTCAAGRPLLPATVFAAQSSAEVSAEQARLLEASVVDLVEAAIGRSLKSARVWASLADHRAR
ncbi:MAG: DNA repair protein RecO [Deltaproteobacteria bacterium]|nr:DNA repair protein RecO [Deltaproteobacteria bacterium]